MEEQTLFENEFDRQYGDSYRESNSSATNPDHQLPGNSEADSGQSLTDENGADTEAAKTLAKQVMPKTLGKSEIYGYPVQDFINRELPSGRPGNSRHDFARKLLYDLICLYRGDGEHAKRDLLEQAWVQEIVDERGMAEIDRLTEWALKMYHKREAENFSVLRRRGLRHDAAHQMLVLLVWQAGEEEPAEQSRTADRTHGWRKTDSS